MQKETIERLQDGLSVLEGCAQLIYDTILDMSEDLTNEQTAAAAPGTPVPDAALCDTGTPASRAGASTDGAWRDGFAAGFTACFSLASSVCIAENGSKSDGRRVSNA